MTIDGHLPGLFNSQLAGSSRLGNGDQGCEELFGSQHFSGIPVVEAMMSQAMSMPMGVQNNMPMGVQNNMPMGVQNNLTDQFNRKRTRGLSFDQSGNYCFADLPPTVGDKISLLIRQQQMETDSLINEHVKKLKMDLLGRHAQQTKQLLASLSEGYLGKMKEQSDEIWRKGRDIWFLEQKIQKLTEDNKSLMNSAMTSEANANSIQGKLDQLLDYYNSNERMLAVVNAEEVESQCDSNYHIVELAGETEGGNGCGHDGFVPEKYKCKACGEMEASVLLLPCKHLCLCSSCGNNMRRTCPACETNIDATIRVNVVGRN
ncbi:BOI-related E3 ubiquitin-protein ligase 1-like [Impatiens glandulifera]|uniref:BOI-related E3 ubiquitin-protein ligase 1-like n=1 Tax=Impatiens glandulifera TaxID=253017 RepID=UPI001FB196DE|nr:BOI-related E3 ubiquitin-protein ligase 1-like [Impatiens glandulifera]